MSNVLIIGDTHAPCMHKGYPDFIRDRLAEYDIDHIVHIGDLVDNCALSFHLKKPNLKDPVKEQKLAQKQVDRIVKVCDGYSVDLLIGNHDALPYRWANEVGVPEAMLRDMSQVWNLPSSWVVHKRFSMIDIDGVLYQHGDRGKGGRMAAANNAKVEFRSVVQGHLHAQAGIEFHANHEKRVFGMQVGCGVDSKHAAMEYGIKFSSRPILGCGVVIGGTTPIFEPMLL